MSSLSGNTTKLSNTCRACLVPVDSANAARCLLDDNVDTLELITRLQSVSCLQITLNDKFPSYLCKECEEKTLAAYEFQKTCKQSDDFVKAVLGPEGDKDTSADESGNENITDHDIYAKEIKREEIEIDDIFQTKSENNKDLLLASKEQFSLKEEDNSDNYFIEPDELEYIKIEVTDEPEPVETVAKKQKLKQVGKALVDSLIEAVKKRVDICADCRFCDYVSSDIVEIRQHVTQYHRGHEEIWCEICNKTTENLSEHRTSHDRYCKCPICPKLIKDGDCMIEHLKCHAETTPGNGEDAENAKQMKTRDGVKPVPGRFARLELFPLNLVKAEIDKVREKLANRTVDCSVCPFNAVNMKALAAHMFRMHKDQRNKWCQFCNQIDIKNLDRHKAQFHSDETKCKFCDKQVVQGVKYIEHLRRHADRKKLQCPHCDKTFIDKRYLDHHMKTHEEVIYVVKEKNDDDDNKDENEDDKLLSEIDKQNVREEEWLTVEIKMDDGEDQNTDLAEKNPPSKPTLYKICKICRKAVSSLGAHIKNCHSEPEVPFICQHCKKTFTSRNNLRAHLRIHNLGTPFKCEVCEKSFRLASYLKIHMLFHTKEKPFICQVCGKGFARSSMLLTHMRIHTGKPEKCEICDKRYCRKSELRIHMRKHTGELPFVCDQCGKSFSHSSNMFNHRRTHFDTRPYKCSHCGRGFTNNETKKAHEFTHTGEKPYKCNQCTFTCIKSSHLTKHMTTHKSDLPQMNKPYECEICTKRFQTRAHLSSHFDRYHQSSQKSDLTYT